MLCAGYLNPSLIDQIYLVGFYVAGRISATTLGPTFHLPPGGAHTSASESFPHTPDQNLMEVLEQAQGGGYPSRWIVECVAWQPHLLSIAGKST